MSTILRPPVDLRRVVRCTDCGRLGRPLLRAYGMPSPDVDWERHEREGRYILMGCCPPHKDDPVAGHECRHCGEEIFLAQ